MKCPKCGGTLRGEQHLSGGSGLLRQDGRSAPVMVTGYTCWRCGFWRDEEPVTVMETVPESGYNAPERSQAGVAAAAFYDNIEKQRAAGSSWYTITLLINKAGYPCQEKMLQRRFLEEQAKRGGCGQAAKKTDCSLSV